MNSTTITTLLGLVMAAGVAAVTYLQAGVDLTNPLWWIGMVTAIATGLKGYYTKGVDQPK